MQQKKKEAQIETGGMHHNNNADLSSEKCTESEKVIPLLLD